MDFTLLPDLILVKIAEKFDWLTLKIFRILNRRTVAYSQNIFFRKLQTQLICYGTNPLTLAIKFSWRSFLDWCCQNNCQLTKEDLIAAIESGASLEIIQTIGKQIGLTTSSKIRVSEAPRSQKNSFKPSDNRFRQRNLLQVCLSTAISKFHRPVITWLLSRKTKVDAESISQAIFAGHLPALKRILLKKKAHVKHVILAAKIDRRLIFEYLTLRISIGNQTLAELAQIAIDRCSTYLLDYLHKRDYNFDYRFPIKTQRIPSADDLKYFLNHGFIVPYPLLYVWSTDSLELVKIVAQHLSQIDFSVDSEYHSTPVIQTLVEAGLPAPFQLMGYAIATDNCLLMIFLLSKGYLFRIEEIENLLAYNAEECIRYLNNHGQIFPGYLVQKVYLNSGTNNALSYLFSTGTRLSPEINAV